MKPSYLKTLIQHCTLLGLFFTLPTFWYQVRILFQTIGTAAKNVWYQLYPVLLVFAAYLIYPVAVPLLALLDYFLQRQAFERENKGANES